MINEMRIVHHIVRIRITVIHIRQNIYQTSDCKRLKSQSVLDSFKLFLSFLKQAPVEREPIGNAERRSHFFPRRWQLFVITKANFNVFHYKYHKGKFALCSLKFLNV
jgi:hypothetical protein